MRRAHTMVAAALFAGAGCGVAPGDAEVVTDKQQALALSAVSALAPAASAVVVAAPAPVVVGTGSVASCTEAALTAALAAGGLVTFNCGGAATIAITSPKTIANTVTVDGGGNVTLSGNFRTGLFSVSATGSLTLQRIVLDKAFSSAANGAAISSHGVLMLSQVTISHSLGSNVNGGAIYTDGPFTQIDASVFDSNTAWNGGAIFVAHTLGATVDILNSTFSNNVAEDRREAPGLGGALLVGNGPHVTVLDTTFLSNRALSGGAIYTYPSAVLAVFGSLTTPPVPTAMQFNGNSVVNDGGAIYNQGTLTVDNAEFSTNQAPQDNEFTGFGGAIFNVGSLELLGGDFYGNGARFGGAVFVGSSATSIGSATIDDTLFRLNTSGSLGGGLYTAPHAGAAPSVTITRSSFYYNASNDQGGGLARFDSQLRVESSSFIGNSAVTNGGGLFIWADATNPYVRIQSVTVGQNTASQGGGIFNNGAGIEMYSMTIAGNTGGVATDVLGNSRFRDTVLLNYGYTNCTLFSGSISDDGANFASDFSCRLGAQSRQGRALDPLLGPLTQDPAGLTWFFKPLGGSPLIDQGFSCPPLDQVGAARIGACDIGAVEAGRLKVVFFPPLPPATLSP